MNDRIGRLDQLAVFVVGQTKLCPGEIAAENFYARMQTIEEAGEIHVQLKRLPQAPFGFALVLGANQQIQRVFVAIQKIGGDVSADVSGRAGQEYRHVAPLVPVLTVSLFAAN